MKRLACHSLLLACAAPVISEPPLQTNAVDEKVEAPPPVVDRTQAPAAGAEAELRLPRVERFALSSGLEVRLAERHALPLASVVLVVRGAGSDADPHRKAGLAALTADLLDEGTARRSALALADDVAMLGASLETGCDWDAATVRLDTLVRTLASSLEIFGEVVSAPALSARELDRVKADRLTRIVEERAEPQVVARNVLAASIYGERHPYGWPAIGRHASLRALRRADVVDFHRRRFAASHATLIVVGDVTRAVIEPMLERVLGAWRGTGGRAGAPAAPPQAPGPSGPRLVLVDREGAPQSEVRVGHASVPRDHADRAALDVLEAVLGGTFSSRLNNRLREQLGFTYGVYSRFELRRGAGPLVAGGAIKTEHTAEAIRELFAEIARVRDKPVGDAELAKARSSVVRSLPARFEAGSDVASELAVLAVHDLPDDFFANYARAVVAVSASDLGRVARAHLDPPRLVVVVVGDRKAVEPGLAALGLGAITVRDVEGASPRPKGRGHAR
ncbi:MAG: pitrilysin family protein [Myxococcota bacterium]